MARQNAGCARQIPPAARAARPGHGCHRARWPPRPGVATASGRAYCQARLQTRHQTRCPGAAAALVAGAGAIAGRHRRHRRPGGAAAARPAVRPAPAGRVRPAVATGLLHRRWPGAGVPAGWPGGAATGGLPADGRAGRCAARGCPVRAAASAPAAVHAALAVPASGRPGAVVRRPGCRPPAPGRPVRRGCRYHAVPRPVPVPTGPGWPGCLPLRSAPARGRPGR